MARGPARPGAPAARRSSSDDGVDTMKVTGVLFMLSAALSLVMTFVRKGEGASSSEGATFGGAFMVLLLGAGLFQGVGAVRIFVLVCAGLGSLAGLAGLALFNSLREIQALMGALLLICLGYLVLLVEKRASAFRVVTAVTLVVAGAGASLGAQLWLAGYQRRAFAKELRPLLSAGREYKDAASGVSLSAPPGWSLLREDADLFTSVPAKLKLADPDAGTVAFINDEPKPMGLLSLDHYLDSVLKGQKEAGLAPKQKDRRDTAVGKAPARRMAMSWVHAKRPYTGFVSVWLDGPRIFTLFGAAVGEWSDATEARFNALEQALRFSAPVETALSEAQRGLSRECPVFTEDAVRILSRRIPPSSAPESYFRAGWYAAMRGQSQIDATTASDLRDLMRDVFAHMPNADRTRFGSYSERIRAGSATTAGEDAAAMKILGSAAAALPPESLARLRFAVDAAVTLGSLM